MTDIVLCDDHAVFAEALSTVLAQHGFTVSAVADSLTRARQTLRLLRPELCLLDRHFGDGDSIEVLAELAAANAGTKIVVLTADDDPGAVVRALRAGAAGYLHKTGSVRALTSAMRRVLVGEVVVDVPSPRRVRAPRELVDAHRLAGHLTPRERECLEMLVEGIGTGDMERRLGVSTTTVRTHVQALLTKLGVHSRLEAASFAVRHSLVPVDRSG